MKQNPQLIINRENAWILIGLGQLRLMIPQQQVETLEAYAVMEMGVVKNSEIGHFPTEDYRAPIYCFSEELKLLRTTPQNYSYFVVVRHQQHHFGLCCESVNTHSAGHNKPEIPLPGCMLSSSAVFKHYAIINNQLYLVADSAALFNLIQTNTNSAIFTADNPPLQTSTYGASS